jgi:hypothetical protein
MKKLTLIAFAAAVLIAGAFAWKAEATTRLGAPASASRSLLQPAACWCGPYRCACGHPYYRRGYYYGGPRRCWWRAGVRVCA